MGSTGVQQPLEPAARSGTRSSHSTALPPGSSPRRARGCPPTLVQHGPPPIAPGSEQGHRHAEVRSLS